MKRYLHDITIAFESILANKLKSVLTALGIIFGVAAVISMLAIGAGAQQEILEQIEMVGVNNIIITPIVPADQNQATEGEQEEQGQSQKFSPGLTLLDAEAIVDILPSVEAVSPEISVNSYVVKDGIRQQARIMGVNHSYFDLFNLEIARGNYFGDHHEEHGLPVCVIGDNIRAKFFAQSDPINKYIKFGHVWLKVIGVLEKSNVEVSAVQDIGVNVQNDNIYVPVKTILMRYQNRAVINSRDLKNTGGGGGFIIISSRSSNPSENTSNNYHQLDKIVVQVKETEQLTPTTRVLSRMLMRRHEGVQDFEITVPEMLLKQQQRAKDIFNVVLGAIASISLIVGGIGIMNIMFASVMERIKEIGTRLAIGAKKQDIVVQFLAEAVLISVTGGIIGVILGVIMAFLIERFADITTIVSPFAVFIAFFVSASVGVIFGYTPAKRASEKDPIESLRYE